MRQLCDHNLSHGSFLTEQLAVNGIKLMTLMMCGTCSDHLNTKIWLINAPRTQEEIGCLKRASFLSGTSTAT